MSAPASCGTRASAHDGGLGRREPLAEHVERLVTTEGLRPGQAASRRRRPGGGRKARRAPRPRPPTRSGERSFEHRAGNGVGNDLHRADHLARDHRLVGRQRRDRDRLVDGVDGVDAGGLDEEHAGLRREEVGAAGERALDGRMGSGDGLGEAQRRLVLADIARLEPDRDDLRRRRPRASRSASSAVTSLPFLTTASPARTMCAAIAPTASCTGTGPNFTLPPPVAAQASATISARIESAISAGLTAPMSRPIGAWMRATASSPKSARSAARPGAHASSSTRARRYRSTRP